MLRRTLRPLAHTIRSLVGTNGLSDRLAALETAARAPAAGGPAAAAPPPRQDVPAAAAPAPPAIDVNLLLHQSRGALLRAMPPGAQRLLSAGCAGLWYFDWIEQTYGPVPEHLGIEFYSPEPDGLPANVTWIANTASNMSAVADASCDLVFSGQNLEHLWPDEVAGFALEAARVLRPGGHLVIDSPNRLVTAPQNWSHPEHTIELTPGEACELAALAGLDVTSVKGIWLCRDPRSGAILPFDPNAAAPDWSVTERLLAARDHPDDSFIWWVEAVRTDRAPDPEAVHALMDRLFRAHWPERVQRLLVPAAHALHPSPDGDWIEVAAGVGGIAMFGPYMPLRAGRYRATWRLRTPDASPGPVAACEVMAGSGDMLARCEVLAGETTASLEFAVAETTFGLQFRCAALATAGFSVLREVGLEEHPA